MDFSSSVSTAARMLQQSAAAAADQQATAAHTTATVTASADDPPNAPWGPAGSVLLCLLPFAFLLAVTLVRRLTLPCSRSLPIAAVMLAVIRLTYLASPPLSVLGSCLKGLLEGVTPLSVIYGAILLFEAMQHSKCLPWMMHQVKGLSAGHPLAEVFLIGWAFAYMISGVGGFNTPIALGAPMLASLGHDPLISLLVVVILNTLASHMGSVGMAIWFGFKSLDLGQENILQIGLKSAIIVGAISFLVAPVAASFLVPVRDILRSSLFVTLSIASAVVPTVLFAMFSPEFPVLVGGVVSLIGTTLLVYYKIGLKPPVAAAAAAAAVALVPGLDDGIEAKGAAAAAAAADESDLHSIKAALKHGSDTVSHSSGIGTLWQMLRGKQHAADAAVELHVGDQHEVISSSSIGGNHGTAREAVQQQQQQHDDDYRQDSTSLRRLLPSVHCSSNASMPTVAATTGGVADRRWNPLSWFRWRAAAATVAVDRAALHSAVRTAAWPDQQQQQQQATLGQEQQQAPNLGQQGTVEISVITGSEDGSSSHAATATQIRPAVVEDTVDNSSSCSSLEGSDVPMFLNRLRGVDLPAQSRLRVESTANLSGAEDLPNLATISAPASYWNSRGIQHVSNHQGYDFVIFSPIADLHGCEDLWEDAHSLGALPLPASLVGATIHHAGLSGVSSGAQRSVGLPFGLTAFAVPAIPRVQHHHRHHHHHHHTQHDIESAYEGSEESPDNQAAAAGANDAKQGKSLERRVSHMTEVVCRMLPVWLTVLLLLITRVRQLKIQAAFQSTEPSLVLQLGTLGTLRISASLVIQLQQLFLLPGINWKYETLYVPCLLPFVVASVVTIWLYKAEMDEQRLPWYAIFTHAWRKMKGTWPALLGAMVLSELISAGGTGSPAFIIGYYLSAWLGKGYLALAGFLGALGSFISGSVMSGNMTFGAIQKVAAERIGVPATSMLAVQVAGSCAGKMMCMSNILSAKVLMNLNQVKEGKIVRRTAPLAVLFVLASQLLGLGFILGGAWPDSPMPAAV